jgi:hypothetical protein
MTMLDIPVKIIIFAFRIVTTTTIIISMFCANPFCPTFIALLYAINSNSKITKEK